MPIPMWEIPEEQWKFTEEIMYGLCKDETGKKYAGKIKEVL